MPLPHSPTPRGTRRRFLLSFLVSCLRLDTHGNCFMLYYLLKSFTFWTLVEVPAGYWIGYHAADQTDDWNDPPLGLSCPRRGGTWTDGKNRVPNFRPCQRDCDSYKAVATYQKNENRLTLAWEPCDTTDTYYVYRYNPETKRLSKERTVTGKTECNYRKVEAGKSYYFIVSTKELSEKAGYTGAFSAVFTIPNN